MCHVADPIAQQVAHTRGNRAYIAWLPGSSKTWPGRSAASIFAEEDPMADKKRRTARSATTRASHAPSLAPTESMIAERAYSRWLARGCPISDGREDWFAAQAELQGSTPRSALRSLS
jgi:hypothetical protein